jgi:hypothetical protein
MAAPVAPPMGPPAAAVAADDTGIIRENINNLKDYARTNPLEALINSIALKIFSYYVFTAFTNIVPAFISLPCSITLFSASLLIDTGILSLGSDYTAVLGRRIRAISPDLFRGLIGIVTTSFKGVFRAILTSFAAEE